MKEKIEIIKLIQTKKYVEAENLINSIIKNGQIDSELISYFKEYNKKYIQSIIYKLRNDNIIQNTYSVSGWLVFFKREIINHIQEYIQNDTIIANKKLLLLRYLIENDIVTDIIRDI